MSDHDTTNIETYLGIVALVGEARREDAFALVGNLEPTEQIDVWIAGCSVAFALATELADHLGIPADKVPAWLRAMATTDVIE